ncbi:hypothetical protein [Microbulbifer elongatus]|uniref:hypothetical protein n=1 Tax=Microbulbifer elongatus TaxID=86173 RepID=UPI001CFC5FC8|nr:hypothetical protein [Microbulbifer elongatus]
MPEIHHLSPVRIRDVHNDQPGFNLRKLLAALCDSKIKLYQLIPPGISVDQYPKKDTIIDITGFLGDENVQEWRRTPTRVWPASDQLRDGPFAVQISPNSVVNMAKEVLYELVEKGLAALEINDFFDPYYVADNGSELILVKTCYPILDLGPNDPAFLSPNMLKFGTIYFEAERLVPTFGDLVISQNDLDTLIHCPERLTPKELTVETRNKSSINHPAKDPSLDIYAPELRLALEIWEAFYLRQEKPEHLGHTRAAVNFVRKQFPSMEISEQLIKDRIGPVSNIKKNKSSGNRGKGPNGPK